MDRELRETFKHFFRTFCHKVKCCLGISSSGDESLFLNQKGDWSAPSGGGTPSAPNTSIQYNNAGSFGGSANFTFDSTTNILNLNRVDNLGSNWSLTLTDDIGGIGIPGFNVEKGNIATEYVHVTLYDGTIFGSSPFMFDAGWKNQANNYSHHITMNSDEGFIEAKDALGRFKYYFNSTGLQIDNFSGSPYILPLQDGTVGQIITTDGAGNTGWQSLATAKYSLNSYATDGDADADTNLPSGGLYKLNAGRAVYQKP